MHGIRKGRDLARFDLRIACALHWRAPLAMKREDPSSGKTEERASRPLQTLWQIVVHVDRSKFHLAQALRNTLGVVAPLVVGQALGMPRGGLAMASGALNVSYSDGS